MVALARALDVDLSRVNALGGALAYGHPFGASGARLVAQGLAVLRARGARTLVAVAAHPRGAGAIVLEAM